MSEINAKYPAGLAHKKEKKTCYLLINIVSPQVFTTTPNSHLTI